MKRISSILLVLFLLCTSLGLAQPSYASGADYDIQNGRFYTQAAASYAPAGYGFAITDEGTDIRGQPIKLWSEYKRLGGATALGYPISQRFTWAGFTCLATQRVVLQWRPESRTVAFINVFDLASSSGKDSYLEAVRQVPKPAAYNDVNKPFSQVINERLALLNTRPAIRTAYQQYGAAAIDLNGLPVAPIKDAGDAYVLRAQRVVFQEWKKDMPWARAGQVTVALGGDIAKEIGLIQAQSATAINPIPPLPPLQTPSSVTPAQVSSDPAIQAAAAVLIRFDRENATNIMETLVKGQTRIIFYDGLRAEGIWGAWLPSRNTIYLERTITAMGTPAIVSVLAHESNHAYSTLTGVKIVTQTDCYDEEFRAFKHEARVWTWLYGPFGKPDPQNAVERDANSITLALLNDPNAFYAAMAKAYQQQCSVFRP